jgi:hypothetical protein
LPVFTRPRGSRKAIFESGEIALKDLKASARDSAFVLLKPGVAAARPDSLEAAVDVAAAGLKRPVHSFGVVHAFGAAASLASSFPPFSASVLAISCSASMLGVRGSSGLSSEAGLGVSRGTAFGTAGITGAVDFEGCFGATGVVSPPTGRICCCVEDGVVGFVDSAFSDVGWLVKGDSGLGIFVSVIGCDSTFDVDSSSELAPCVIIGSSTGSADSCGIAFRFRRARLAGHERSGLESHGSYFGSVMFNWGKGSKD